jgi:hypothetical protein
LRVVRTLLGGAETGSQIAKSPPGGGL